MDFVFNSKTTVLHNLQSVESMNAEPRIWKNQVARRPTGKFYVDFPLCRGSVHLILCCSRINCNCSIPKSNPEFLNLFVDEERGNKTVSVVINSN